MLFTSCQTSSGVAEPYLEGVGGGEGLPLDPVARAAAAMSGRPLLIYRADGGAPVLVGRSGAVDSQPGFALAAAHALASRSSQLSTGAVGPAALAQPILARDGRVAAILVFTGNEVNTSREIDLTDLSQLVLGELERVDLARAAECLEREVLTLRNRYREMSRTVSSGVAVVSPAGTIEEINQLTADILAELPERIIGRDFREFVAPEDMDRAVGELRSRLEGDSTRRETELRIVRPGGERRLLLVCSSAILGDVGVEGVYFAGRDITDEKARDAQLRRAERLASVAPLLSGVCHELNNPLTSIKSFAELMLLDDRPPEDVEAIEIIQREAARAGRIVSDLRLVARQTQEEAANAAVLDINELLRTGIDMIRAECCTASVEVDIDLQPDVPPIFGVRSQLERVITQLLTNAIQAMRHQSARRRISVRTARCELGASFRVTDSGPGVDPGHVDHIFDPFWTTRPTGEGTGLGLSLAHSIVTDHHGTIRLDSTIGEGATFTVELPAASTATLPGREITVHAPARKSLRILVVDDEGPIRFSLARYMERRGHSVRGAEEGQQALTLLDAEEERPFDVILADLRMPGLGGEQLYARLKERGQGLEDRLIFITGDAESPDAAALLREAGVPVVLKPFELAEIAQIIETHAGVMGG